MWIFYYPPYSGYCELSILRTQKIYTNIWEIRTTPTHTFHIVPPYQEKISGIGRGLRFSTIIESRKTKSWNTFSYFVELQKFLHTDEKAKKQRKYWKKHHTARLKLYKCFHTSFFDDLYIYTNTLPTIRNPGIIYKYFFQSSIY